MNLSLLKLKLANEPVWLVQALNAAVGIAVAVLSGGNWQSLVPSVLAALSAPLIRSRVTPVRKVAQLVNEALHTPAPGPGPVESAPAAPAAAPSAAVQIVTDVAKAVEADLASKVLPPTK
jgi:hypothetical protein